jgi:hypothetical protein
VARLEEAPVLVRWFGARGAVAAAYALGVLFIGLFLLMSCVDADSAGDWVVVILGAGLGTIASFALARRGTLFGPARRSDAKSVGGAVAIGAVAAALANALGASDRVWLAFYGVGMAVIAVGVVAAWPWRTSIERWSAWRG